MLLGWVLEGRRAGRDGQVRGAVAEGWRVLLGGRVGMRDARRAESGMRGGGRRSGSARPVGGSGGRCSQVVLPGRVEMGGERRAESVSPAGSSGGWGSQVLLRSRVGMRGGRRARSGTPMSGNGDGGSQVLLQGRVDLCSQNRSDERSETHSVRRRHHRTARRRRAWPWAGRLAHRRSRRGGSQAADECA